MDTAKTSDSLEQKLYKVGSLIFTYGKEQRPLLLFSFPISKPVAHRRLRSVRFKGGKGERVVTHLPRVIVTCPLLSTPFRRHARTESRTKCFGLYIVLLWKKKRSSAVQPGPKTTISESLELEFLNVNFRVLRRFKYEDKLCKATLKSPSWFFDLQPSAPVDGYMMQRGEFSATLSKDGRITQDQKITVEVTEF